MRINALCFGCAGGMAMSTSYAIAAACVYYFPDNAFKIFSAMHMITTSRLWRFGFGRIVDVTPKNVVIGMGVHFVFWFFFFWMLGTLYNFLTRQ